MNEKELERRLTTLVVRRLSANAAILNGFPQLGCVDTLEGLDGFFSKLVTSVKNTIVKPIQFVEDVTKNIISGGKNVDALKADLHFAVGQVKSDLMNIAPVAAVVVNVIPGVGQLASVGITAAAAAGKAMQAADKAKNDAAAALAEQTRVNAEAQKAYDEALVLQTANDKAASDQANAIAAQTADLKKRTDDMAAQTAAIAAATAAHANTVATVASTATNLLNTGAIAPGMTPDQMAAAIIGQQMLNNGTAMTSPDAKQLVNDVASDAVAKNTAGFSGNLFSMLPWLLAGGVGVYFMSKQSSSKRGTSKRSISKRKKWG